MSFPFSIPFSHIPDGVWYAHKGDTCNKCGNEMTARSRRTKNTIEQVMGCTFPDCQIKVIPYAEDYTNKSFVRHLTNYLNIPLMYKSYVDEDDVRFALETYDWKDEELPTIHYPIL